MVALEHFKAHGYGLQHGGSFCGFGIAHAHVLAKGAAKLHIVLQCVSCGGARYEFSLESHLGHTLVHNRVAREVNEGFGCGEKGKFLAAFVRHGSEVLLMCLAKKGEDANGGLYDFPQRFHFTRLRYGSLEECQLRSFPHPPNRQWDTNLRVVAAGGAHHRAVGREHLIEPLLHRGLAIASRNAHNGYVEAFPVAACKHLERTEGVVHKEKACIGEIASRHFAHHKAANSALVEVGDELMSIAASGLQRKE